MTHADCKINLCSGYTVEHCAGLWCPYQAMLCRYHRAKSSEFEALRALPLPQKIFAPISRNPKYIQCHPDFVVNVAAFEERMNRALDGGLTLDEADQTVRQVLPFVGPRRRKMIGLLMATQDSSFQFSFSTVAHRLTEVDRGIPAGSPPSAWTTAKSRNLTRVRETWSEALEILRPLLSAALLPRNH